MVLVAYLVENTLVHVIDIGIAGAAAFLIARGGKGAGIGMALATIYLIAVIGGFLGDAPTDYFGPIAAVVSALVFGVVGWQAKRRALNAPN